MNAQAGTPEGERPTCWRRWSRPTSASPAESLIKQENAAKRRSGLGGAGSDYRLMETLFETIIERSLVAA